MDRSLVVHTVRLGVSRIGRWLSMLLQLAARAVLRCPHRQRLPVVLQMSAVECGAACLAMILTYYGRRTRLAECGEAWGTGRDGVTAHALVAAARRHGLRVKAVSLEIADFKLVPLPAI